MTKVLTARLSDALVDEIQQSADKQQLSISEVVRRALVAYLKSNPETHFERLLYEIAITRAYCVATLGARERLEQAEIDAKEYVKEQLEKETQ